MVGATIKDVHIEIRHKITAWPTQSPSFTGSRVSPLSSSRAMPLSAETTVSLLHKIFRRVLCSLYSYRHCVGPTLAQAEEPPDFASSRVSPSPCVFVSKGCRDKLVQPWCSQFWRLEVQNPGVSKATFLPEV